MDEQTVFIVDDDPAVRDSIKELVESVALRAEVFATGQAFVDAVEPSRSGCLILDVRLAGMSGLILQEKLHELGFTAFQSSCSLPTLTFRWPCVP